MKPLDSIRDAYIWVGGIAGLLFAAGVSLISFIGNNGDGSTELFEQNTVKTATCYLLAAGTLAAIVAATVLQSGLFAMAAVIVALMAAIAYFVAAAEQSELERRDALGDRRSIR